MHFSLATIIAVVPLLASATPLAHSPRTTIPISKKDNLHRDDGSVDIEALKASVAASTAKMRRNFDTYQQNTGKREPYQPDNHERAVGTVLLTEAQEHYWYGNISVGTPPVDYTVKIDTGRSELFIPSSSCDSTCDGHKKYDSSSSSTSKSLGKNFDLYFLDGSQVYGDLYTDNVKIGGIIATNQTFGAALQYSTNFQSPKFVADGLLGMGFQNASSFRAPTVFQNLVSEGKTSSAVFAFKLAKEGSELSIGGLDSSAYSGTPAYASVKGTGSWTIIFSSLTVDRSPVVDAAPAFVDPTTNLIIGPHFSVQDFYKKIPGSKQVTSSFGPTYYTFPCSEIVGLPVIAFTIGGKSVGLSTSSFNLGPVSDRSEDCIGSIVGHINWSEQLWYFGGALMENYYTIFDYGEERVGFADLVRN